MKAYPMEKQMQAAIFLQDSEVSKLDQEFIKVLQTCFSLIEMESFLPSHVLQAGIHLFSVYHPERKIDQEAVKSIAMACDKRKHAHKEVVHQEKPIKTQPKRQAELLAVNSLIKYLKTRKPHYAIIALRQFSTHKNLISNRPKLLSFSKECEEQLENRARLFNMLAEQLKEGRSLRDLLKQRLFESLVSEVKSLAKEIDKKKFSNKKEMISNYFFVLRGEDSRSNEMLFLRMLFQYVKTPSYKTYLQSLYKNWPNKNERKETALIVHDINLKFEC